ncbi:MAG: hypothetical protein CMK59_01875 [Proteobacteria bacterium]|nr:hypothetical protein [Pseudomonadota bacterium]
MLLLLKSVLFLGAHASESEFELVVEEKRSESAAELTLEIDDRFHESMDLGDVLRSSTGSFVRSFGGLGDASTVSIRGASSRQVEIFLDGISLNPDGISSVNLAELPLHAFSSVQIWRTVPPFRLLSTSIGGAINLTPQNSGTVGSFSAGSFGWKRAEFFYGGSKKTEHLLFINGYQSAGEYPYFDNNSTLYNTQDDQFRKRHNNHKTQGSVLGSLKINGTQLLYSGLLRSTGIPGSISMRTEQTAFDVKQHMLNVRQVYSTLKSHHQINAWSVIRNEHYRDPLGELPSGAQETDSLFTTIGSQAQSHFFLSTNWSTSLALSGRFERLNQSENLQTEITKYIRSIVKAQWSIARNTPDLECVFFLQESLLFEEEKTDQLNPRLSVVKNYNRSKLWLQTSRGFRPPDFTERFGQTGVILPNPDLKPESSWSTELGISITPTPTVHIQLAHFQNWGRDRIILVQNAQKLAIPINFSQTHSLGLEAYLLNNQLDFLTTETSITWIKTQNRSSIQSLYKNQLPQIPAWSGTQLLLFHFNQWSFGHQLYCTALSYTDATNHHLTPARILHNSNIRWQKESFSLEFELRNIRNKISQESLLDPLQPNLGNTIRPLTDFVGYPLMGRSLYLTLKFTPKDL